MASFYLPSAGSQMSMLSESHYSKLLTEDLVCFRCTKEFPNMPLLKAHLQEEWDEEQKKKKMRRSRYSEIRKAQNNGARRKRPHDDSDTDDNSSGRRRVTAPA
jgi:aprataxin